MIGTFLLAVGLAVSPALQADDAAKRLGDDLKFAENLALYRYYDLALGVLDDVDRAVDRVSDDNLEGEASLTRARVLVRKADNTADDVAGLEIRNQAIELLSDWSKPGSSYAYHDKLVYALEELAALLRDRGTLHAARFSEGETGARAKAEADFKQAESVYTTLQQEAQGLADQYDENDLPDKANEMRERAAMTLYFRGINGIEWSDVSEDPALRLERAYDFLDDFQWEQPQQNLVTFRAQYQTARADEKMGNLDETVDLLDNMNERLLDEYWHHIDEFSPLAQLQIGDLLDQVWGYQARLAAESGDLDKANGWIDTLLKEHAKTGVRIGRQGFKTLISWARTLDDLGQSRRATEIVKIVADGAVGTAEGQIAEVMLADLVRGGGEQSPDVLMQAARGHETRGNWSEAGFTYERAAAGLSSESDLRELGYAAWMGAGKALRNQSRHLEAAVAFDQALELGRRFGATDDEIDNAASALYGSYEQRYRETNDAFDKAQRDSTSARLAALPGIELDLAFISATEAFGEVKEGDVQGYLSVRADLEGVPENSPNYEKALVLGARALAGAGRVDDAVAAFRAIEARDSDPALQPTNATGRKRRQAAMAQARYYHADLLLQDNVARPTDALAVLEGFENQLDEQETMFPLVKFKRVLAYAMAGAIDDGERALVDLTELGAKATLVSAAAYRVGVAAEAAARTAQGLGDEARGRDLLQRAADAMWTYSETSGHDSLSNLMSAGEWYIEAGEAASAQRVFEASLAAITRKRDTSAQNLERARMGLAEALDLQRDFGRSRTIWQELRAANTTSFAIKRGAARCFGGWMELADDGTIVEIKGSGDFELAIELWTELARGYKIQQKYTGPWWEAQLGAVYGYYNLRNLQPDKGASARKVIESLKLTNPRFDADSIGNLEPDQKYSPLYQPFFRHLDKLLPAS